MEVLQASSATSQDEPHNIFLFLLLLLGFSTALGHLYNGYLNTGHCILLASLPDLLDHDNSVFWRYGCTLV
jgi:hypothetical protein